MRQFRKHQIKLLLTTDVAARGLDIPKLPAVVNYELPQTVEEYVHRTGRTGRQGEPGLVVNLGDDHDFRDLKKLLKDTEYHLEKLTIDNRQLTDEKAGANEQGETVRHENSRHIQKDQRKRDHAIQKSIHRTLDTFTKPKKKKRHKQRKNKGIRLKHRRKSQNENK